MAQVRTDVGIWVIHSMMTMSCCSCTSHVWAHAFVGRSSGRTAGHTGVISLGIPQAQTFAVSLMGPGDPYSRHCWERYAIHVLLCCNFQSISVGPPTHTWYWIIAFATVRFSTPPSSPSSLPLTLIGDLCDIWVLFTLVDFMSLDLAAIAFGKAFGKFCSISAAFLRVKPGVTLCTDYLYSWSLVQQSEHNKGRTWHRCEQCRHMSNTQHDDYVLM